ncbi:hypothetical protein BDF19DRAFT_431544 [Syncephalis fuscata]|nr:hypothetical protein BDF19DRAFT_431544 [Syncephalis fuscata]
MADFEAILTAELSACKTNLEKGPLSTPAYCFDGLFTPGEQDGHNLAEEWALDSLGVFSGVADEGHVERIVTALETAYLTGNYPTAAQTISLVLKRSLTSDQFAVLLSALTTFVRSSVLDPVQARPQVAASLLGTLLPILDITQPSQWQRGLVLLEELLQRLPVTLPMRNLLANRVLTTLVQQVNRLPVHLRTSQLVGIQKTVSVLEPLVFVGIEASATPLSLVDIVSEISIGDQEHWALDGVLEHLRKRRLALAELILPPVDASCSSYAWLLSGDPLVMTSSAYTLLKISPHESTNGNPLLPHISIRELLHLTKAGKAGSVPELIDAFFRNLEDKVVECSNSIAQVSSEKFAAVGADNADVYIPNDFSSFSSIIQLADDLYTLVDSEIVTFEVVTDKFLAIAKRIRERQHGNVNYLLWLLLQLFHIEKVGEAVIAADLASDERLLAKITDLCDEKSMLQQSFSIVDLAMPCSICHQQKRLKDKNLIKFRHPKLASAMAHFANAYKANIVQRSLLHHLSIDEIMRIAIVSQLRQHLVSDTLYVYLVPCDNLETEKMPFSTATFLKGGILDYSLLGLVSVDCRHRLLQLIYKMMLDHETGPRFPNAVEANSVSPYVLEVVANIIYSSPSSAELMISEVFERLRRILAKLAKEENSKEGQSVFSETTWRWISTMAELLSGPLPNIRNRRVYIILESLCVNLLSNGQFLPDCIAILDQISFTGLPLLARITMMTTARMWSFNYINRKTLISEASLEKILMRISAEAPSWAPEIIQHFPEPIRSFVQQTSSLIPPPVLLNAEPEHILNLSPQDFNQPEHQLDVLVYLWWKCINDTEHIDQILTEIRPVLQSIPPHQLMHATIRLAEHTSLAVGMLVSVEAACNALNRLTWQAQVISHNQLIIAFARCNYHMEPTLDLLEGYLLHTDELQKRVQRWCTLFTQHNYWEDENYHERLVTYLNEFPEYNCFEKCGNDTPSTDQETLPVYFYSNILDFTSVFRVVEIRLSLLSATNTTFLKSYSATFVENPPLLMKLLKVLPLESYPFSPIFINYVRSWPDVTEIKFSVEQVVDRLINANKYRKPEWRIKQQYQLLYTTVFETNTMLWPAETIIQSTLDYLYTATATTPLTISQVGAIAQWYAALPREIFLFPLTMAIASAILEVDAQIDDNIQRQKRLFELASSNTTTTSATNMTTPLMALLACLHELMQFAGDCILPSIMEAISTRRPDLAIKGRALRVPQLLAVGLHHTTQQPALASTVSNTVA